MAGIFESHPLDLLDLFKERSDGKILCDVLAPVDHESGNTDVVEAINDGPILENAVKENVS